jgi:Holliday junction DNA helicase RuvA
MIAYLEGKIILKKERFIILNVNGVGYKVFLSQKTLTKIPREEESLKLFCFLNIRENLQDLYGFLSFEELEFFNLLNGIHSIGPKAALEVASLGPLEKIKEAVEKGNEKILEGISMIGKKRAQMIILELSRKIKKVLPKKVSESSEDEALEALINLGFPQQKAKSALSKVPGGKNQTERIKEALKILGR